MTARFIGNTYKEYQRELIDKIQNGKDIRDLLDIPKRQKTSTGPKTHVLGQEYEKSGNQIPNFEIFENYIKDAPKKTCFCVMYCLLVLPIGPCYSGVE